MGAFGWERGRLKSVDRFAEVCIKYKDDANGFLSAIGEEYHIPATMGAGAALRGMLATIADEVEDEVFWGAEKVPASNGEHKCSLCDETFVEGECEFRCCPFCGHPFIVKDS